MTEMLHFTPVTDEEVEAGRAVAAVRFGEHFMTNNRFDETGNPIPSTTFTGYFYSPTRAQHLRASIPMTLSQFVGLKEEAVLPLVDVDIPLAPTANETAA